LHRLQLRYTLIAAQPRLKAAHQVSTIRRAGYDFRLPPADAACLFPDLAFSSNCAPSAPRDFKICLKNACARQILKQKAIKHVKKTQKHVSGNNYLPDTTIYVKTCNRIALKNP
jgi:hypothetical protein